MKAQTVIPLLLSGALLFLPSSVPTAGTAGTSAVTGAPWFTAEVDTDGDTGQYVSVAYDPFTRGTYVSYYDATNQKLRIARDDRATSNCGPGDEWYCMTLDGDATDVGRYSSIAVRPDGNGMGIAYYDAINGALKYLEFDNPYLWVYSVITVDRGIAPVSSTGLYTSLRYNGPDQPVIAYYFDNPSPGGADALMLAYYSWASGNCVNGDDPDAWRCETIITGEGVGQYASLFIQGEWNFHVAYYDGGNGDLWYATSVGDGNCGPYGNDWACYPVSVSGDVGKYASLYVDSGGHFHIAYYSATDDALMYATNAVSSGNCGLLNSAQCDEIDAMPQDYHPLGISIAEDAAGYPIIAYQGEYGSLKIARPLDALGMPPGAGNCGPEVGLFTTWYCETIAPYVSKFNFSYRNGDYASIAVSPAGLATIAHYRLYTHVEPDDGNLVIARQRLQVYLPLAVKNQ